MHSFRGGHVARLTWPEVAACAGTGVPALLAVGASCKEHGLHLPMSSDWLQAEWLAERAAERRALLVWPPLGYGHYPAFVDYAGSVSLDEQTFAATAGAVLDGIARAGVRACVVLNTGVSTIPSLRRVVDASRLRHGEGFRLHNVGDGRHYRAARAALETQRRGGHADEVETSVMLVVAPSLVRLDRAVPADDVEFAAGPLHPTAVPGGNHSPSGAYGDPTRGTADKGRQVLAAMLDDLVEAIDGAAESRRP